MLEFCSTLFAQASDLIQVDNTGGLQSRVQWVLLIASSISIIIAIVTIPIALIAASRMREFQSRGLAIAGSVLIMMPFSLIALAGIPVGIWSLSVLMRDDVRRAFDGKTVPMATTCAQIQKAGIWMVVSGALALLLPASLFIYAMTQTVMQGQFTGEQDKFLAGILGLGLPSLILAGLQIFAGIKMKNRTSIRWSYFSAVFGLVPLNPAWLVSFPSSVYAFAVLGQQTDGVKNNSELFGPSRK